MTYSGFLALFVVPPLVFIVLLCRGVLAHRGWRPIVALLVIVYATATPWDSAAVARGYWGFDQRRIVGVRAFGLPLEELAFFGLQTLLTSIWVRRRLRGAS
jgi:15-cis-phytoene synthase/lycopene beta-cyclase